MWWGINHDRVVCGMVTLLVTDAGRFARLTKNKVEKESYQSCVRKVCPTFCQYTKPQPSWEHIIKRRIKTGHDVNG